MGMGTNGTIYSTIEIFYVCLDHIMYIKNIYGYLKI